MNTIHDFHASVESISQLWNLFHQVRNEGTFFTTLEVISPGILQEQILHQWNLYNIISCEICSTRIYITENYFWGNFFPRNLFWLTYIRVKLLVSFKKQKLLSLHEHLGSSPVFWWGLCCPSL
jgi:hypothetical protein